MIERMDDLPTGVIGLRASGSSRGTTTGTSWSRL